VSNGPTAGEVALGDSTLPPATSHLGERSASIQEHLGFVVLWSRDDWSHVGEVLLLPSAAKPASSWIFGRGYGNAEQRLFLTRPGAGEFGTQRQLTCPRISRNQLRLTAAGLDSVLVENTGTCPLVVGDEMLQRAEIRVGQIIKLRNELLLLCVRQMVPATVFPLPAHAFGQPDPFGLVGESAAMWRLREQLEQAARQPFHVLVLGASGTGKELVARAIHRRSARGSLPLVSRNAATIPEGIADAELFGNAKGYPNVGMSERPGLIGAAHGSTLFLDEIGELPQPIQARLLRVLDSGEYQRLGESRTRHADLRLIGATNRPPTDLKHDVVARLPLRIALPDLNSRREDIPLLAAHLLRQHAQRDGLLAQRYFPNQDASSSPRFAPGFVEMLVTRTYTTNVRELDALLLDAALNGKGPHLDSPPIKGQSPRISKPESQTESWLSAEENARLVLLRKHRFSATGCGRDPEYRGNRQQADLHFRHIACRALAAAQWNVEAAIQLIAGTQDDALREKCGTRLETFLANLERRVRAEPSSALDSALAADWKGLSPAVLQLATALRNNQVRWRRTEAAALPPRSD